MPTFTGQFANEDQFNGDNFGAAADYSLYAGEREPGFASSRSVKKRSRLIFDYVYLDLSIVHVF